MIISNTQLVEAFFAGLKRGELNSAVVSPAMTAWTLTSGNTDQQRFRAGVKTLAQIIDGSLEYELLSLTCDATSAAAEVTSNWLLVNGDRAQNHHLFIFHIDNGLITHVREYMHPSVPREKLGPLIMAIMQQSNR